VILRDITEDLGVKLDYDKEIWITTPEDSYPLTPDQAYVMSNALRLYAEMAEG
jgi:hypothetical protein